MTFCGSFLCKMEIAKMSFGRPGFAIALLTIISGAGVVPLASTASSQSSRTINIVITFPAGSGGDVLTRAMSEEITQAHGVRFTFENTDQFRGAEAVAHAPPDGNTLLVINNNFTINSKLQRPPYDPLTSFVPICNLASGPVLFIADAAGPFHTLADLVAAAREKPGQLTVAGTPLGPPQIAVEVLKRDATVNMAFSPAATPAALNGLSNGSFAAAVQLFPNVQPQLRANKVRALAITSRARKQVVPDVPTVAESGFPGFEVEYWDGIFAPAGTSLEAVAQLADWLRAASQTPAVKEKLEAQTYSPVGVCGAPFVNFIHKELDVYGRIAREAGIKGE
jgi:tripartite-type tricarboxylate transporter receptor subunit TctC